MKWLLDDFLSDALLIGFAICWLLLFVAMLFVPAHNVFVGESNLFVLFLEIVICVFAVIWSSIRVAHNIRRERTR